MLFQGGKISAEEAIDKSKTPSLMVDRMQRAGLMAPEGADEALMAEAEDATGAPAPAGAAAVPAGAAQPSAAEKQAQIAANRARMQAMASKK